MKRGEVYRAIERRRTCGQCWREGKDVVLAMFLIADVVLAMV